MEQAEGSRASGVKAWTAGGLRGPREVELPLLQMDLFTEAGAIVAGRALAAGASSEAVAGILRRAVDQAGRLPLAP